MVAVTTELILIRHGESHANVTPVIGGMRGDRGLTDRGRWQAERLGERLRQEGLRADVLYASTLPRAQETAGYVASALDLPICPEDELQELRVGEADGLSIDEWKRRWPGLADGLWHRPYQPFAPGGESWAGFLVRAGAALTALVERHPDQRIVAVTHGGVLEASFAMAFQLGPAAVSVRFLPENTGVTVWRHEPEPVEVAWSLVTFNDVGHLNEPAYRQPPSEQAVPTPAEDRPTRDT
jgi:probable phosphoglycerate mutase